MFEFIANNYLLVAGVCFLICFFSSAIALCGMSLGAMIVMIIIAFIPYLNVAFAILMTSAAMFALGRSIIKAFGPADSL